MGHDGSDATAHHPAQNTLALRPPMTQPVNCSHDRASHTLPRHPKHGGQLQELLIQEKVSR